MYLVRRLLSTLKKQTDLILRIALSARILMYLVNRQKTKGRPICTYRTTVIVITWMDLDMVPKLIQQTSFLCNISNTFRSTCMEAINTIIGFERYRLTVEQRSYK